MTSMNKNMIIGAVVAIAVVAGGGYYFMNGAAVDPMVADDSGMYLNPDSDGSVQAGKFSGSLADLAARTGSWKCTVDTSTVEAVSSGVTYVSGGKVRSDFSSSVGGYGNIETHMIADGEYVYSWTSMMPQGVKAKMTASSGGADTATAGASADANVRYSYDCQPWTADPSLFVVPSDITFRSV